MSNLNLARDKRLLLLFITALKVDSAVPSLLVRYPAPSCACIKSRSAGNPHYSHDLGDLSSKEKSYSRLHHSPFVCTCRSSLILFRVSLTDFANIGKFLQSN